MLWTCGTAALLALIWLYLIFPGKPSPEARAPFEKRAFAHRGLYEKDQSVPENSLPAFRRAVEAGYGAELDVQETKDHRIVVFHDDDLKRACGRDGRICDYSFRELQEFPLFGTEERIPLFADVLAVFSGRQPLIVELKTVPDNPSLCAAVRKMLAEYEGAACIESFHPGIVRYFRRNDPERLRGQLSQPMKDYMNGTLKWTVIGLILSRLFTNFTGRPQFIAYRLARKPLSVRACERLGAMKVCWTAREAGEHERRMAENDAVIFEHYRPAP